MKNAKPIEKDILNKHLLDYKAVRSNTIARHALVSTPISNVVNTQDNASETDFKFSLEIKAMEATDQKASGRCWIFAATNILREIIAKKLNMSQFELSQSYIAFYDKLEKVNFELEAIIDLIDKDYDDRTLTHILANTIGDGGQWDMFVNVVKKYGVVPKNAMIETFQSSNTKIINQLIDAELKKFAAKAKDLFNEGGIETVRKFKEELLGKIFDLLVSAYGLPVESFDFEYTDKDSAYHLEKGFTPLSFFEKYVGSEIDEYVSLINAPTKDKPFGKTYTIDYLGNVVGGKDVIHLNVTMDRMIELILKQLKDGHIVWFGSDVSFYSNREGGSWDDTSFDFVTPFGLDFKGNKGEALDYRISAMNHAMCITGVNLKDGVPTKWKIENSWGAERAKKGYYIMSDSWFREYTYQAVVKKEYLKKEELEEYLNEPIHLKPWDPMGSLAD